ncbi:MAG TPA: SUMF1/EgtB/PvdO family nonheme iron enzyme [Roseiflexaceae bacterium]|nr:SUMF1/EgtB/PvdO family nonheme iron enzyme [Roseiflexaceae bacterium]
MRHRLRQLAPDLVLVPAGAFLMGSTEDQVQAAAARFQLPLAQFMSETPQRTVELPAYTISRAPVTCADYRAFVIATDHPTPPYWGGDDPPDALLDHPVVGVAWNDARTYCRWLTAATDREFRLPSEAEWEKAARGIDGRTFPWGERWEEDMCNIGGVGTSVVGSFSHDISPYGCVDIAGNVEEWTASRYAPGEPQIVVRGGRWDAGPELAHCARRVACAPASSSLARGFRVVSDEI